MERGVLEIRDMVCGYGGVAALRGISLDVKAGQLVALIGANGAGKSTTLRAISGLVPPRAGQMRFEGIDITFVDRFGGTRWCAAYTQSESERGVQHR